MKWRYCLIGLLLLFPILSSGQAVISLKVNNAITPSTENYIQRGIQKASSSHADALIIELNTPGGLLSSTRNIVGVMLKSPIPIIVYVYPSGARAGSAGLFITLAANIAVMAPGTNIGASHPVVLRGQLDSIENAKVTNDALAFIRSIAQKRHRNIKAAEAAVQSSISYTEEEALDKNLIDIIASNPQLLLQKVNGDSITTASGTKILSTKDAQIIAVSKSFTEEITGMLSDPNLMYVFLIIGILGILFEILNPGGIWPGVGGAISLLLAIYGMRILPINYVGFALLILGIILFVLEIKIVSHGILAIGGLISFFFGSTLLIQSPKGDAFIDISMGIIITISILLALFFFFIVGMGLKAQKERITSGNEGLIDMEGIVFTPLTPTGRIKIVGEIWTAESLSGDIEKDQKVVVTRVQGLKLWVKKKNEDTSFL